MGRSTAAQLEWNELLRQYRSNPTIELRNQLIDRHYNLIGHTIAHYFAWLDQERRRDVVSVGWMALSNAVNHYNPDEGSFSNYAIGSIRRDIGEYVADTRGVIRIPSNNQIIYSRLKKLERLFLAIHLRDVESDDELAQFIGCHAEHVSIIRTHFKPKHPISLDDPVSPHSNTQIDEVVLSDDSANPVMLMKDGAGFSEFELGEISPVLDKLASNLREVLVLRYVFEYSVPEISYRLSLTEAQVASRIKSGLQFVRARIGVPTETKQSLRGRTLCRTVTKQPLRMHQFDRQCKEAIKHWLGILKLRRMRP